MPDGCAVCTLWKPPESRGAKNCSKSRHVILRQLADARFHTKGRNVAEIVRACIYATVCDVFKHEACSSVDVNLTSSYRR